MLQWGQESSSAWRQLHWVDISGGVSGSVTGVCGGVIARVVPTRDTARRSMSDVELGDGTLEVVRRIESWVAGWVRRMARRLVVVIVLGRGILFTRCVSASGT